MQQDLPRMNVPVIVVQSEYDEFIKREHAKYIVESLPNGEFCLLQVVSHFAPLQPLEPANTRYSSSRAKSYRPSVARLQAESRCK